MNWKTSHVCTDMDFSEEKLHLSDFEDFYLQSKNFLKIKNQETLLYRCNLSAFVMDSCENTAIITYGKHWYKQAFFN